MNNPFNALDVLKVGAEKYSFFRLDVLEKSKLTELSRLPFSIRILLEAALRQCNGREITETDVRHIAAWKPAGERPGIPFLPARVIMQDFTGVPAVVDLAAMRAAVARLGGDPRRINPLVPVTWSLTTRYRWISSLRPRRSSATPRSSSSVIASATNS
jgi:aconitate hydratase